MYTDVSEAELEQYRGEVTLPADFDEFWRLTLAESRAAVGTENGDPENESSQKMGPNNGSPTHGTAVSRTRVNTPFTLIDSYDVTFPGFGGDPVRAWLQLPHGTSPQAPIPAVVEYIGYGGGRGHVLEPAPFALAGYAHFIMDTRGQGANWREGETADPHGHGPASQGVMTQGIRDKETYYYRRLFTDAARAIDAVRAFPEIDPDRVAVTGISQGGGVALAAAYLVPNISAVAPRVPFLCDYRHAVQVTDAHPFAEITSYLAAHRDEDERVFSTLAYFDGVNFARKSAVPANVVVGLMDALVPPSTVYAAYNSYAGPKELLVRRHNGHEAGGPYDLEAALHFFRRNFS